MRMVAWFGFQRRFQHNAGQIAPNMTWIILCSKKTVYLHFNDFVLW